MKVYLGKTEWYPVYVIYEEDPDETEVPDELVERFRKAREEFDEVQDRLREIYESTD